MKLIALILLLVCAVNTKAQNWKTASDTSYYRGGKHQAYFGYETFQDSNIIRTSIIDSVIPMNQDTVYHFFKTVRADGLGDCMDTLAPSWLGNHMIHKQDGNEYYFNSIGDTILIKTLAETGNTWVLAKDTSGNIFQATLSQAGTTVVDGIQDSFKLVTIQAFQNGNPVSHAYNNKILELSKGHGWLRTLDLFRFPNTGNGWDVLASFTDSVQLTRIDNLGELDYNFIDLQWKYAAGNEFIYRDDHTGGQYLGSNYSYTHDSVISSYLLNSNTAIVNFKTNRFENEWIDNLGSFTLQLTTNSYTHTDTIVNDTFLPLKDFLYPENKYGYLPNYRPNLYSRNFFDTLCGNRPMIRSSSSSDFYINYDSCMKFSVSISGYGIHSTHWLYGFGKTFYQWESGEYWHLPLFYEKRTFTYLKLPDCTYGTKIDVIALGTENTIKQTPLVNIYPNPAKDLVTLQSTIADKGATITLMDMTGRVLLTQVGLEQSNQINVAGYSAGIYLVNIATEHRSNTYKLVVSN